MNNVSYMKNSLKVLYANGFKCRINQKGIEGLQLVKLNVIHNKKIIIR